MRDEKWGVFKNLFFAALKKFYKTFTFPFLRDEKDRNFKNSVTKGPQKVLKNGHLTGVWGGSIITAQPSKTIPKSRPKGVYRIGYAGLSGLY